MPWRRLACVSALVVATLGSRRSQPRAGDSTRVLVSRREVRVLFSPETTQRWGWSKRSAGANSARYSWVAAVDLFDGPRYLELDVSQTDDRERAFASLSDVVAAGRPQLCRSKTVPRCSDVGLRAGVEGERVVLTLRDSATIMQLFSMRPTTVNVYRGRPAGSDRPAVGRVEYIDPQIPVPDSAFRADVARQRRQYQASINRITRSIGSRNRMGESIVLETGDSTALSVNEMHCSFDACGGFAIGIPDSSWILDDTTIAAVRRPGRIQSGGMLVYTSEGPYLVGQKPGTTILRARNIRSPSDTMPSRDPVPTSLQLELRVIPRLARIEIVPRPDSVRAAETVEFRLRGIDRAGQEVTALAAEWRIQTRPYAQTGFQLTRSVRFDSTGTAFIVARFGNRTDSLAIVVVPPRRR